MTRIACLFTSLSENFFQICNSQRIKNLLDNLFFRACVERVLLGGRNVEVYLLDGEYRNLLPVVCGRTFGTEQATLTFRETSNDLDLVASGADYNHVTLLAEF